MYRGQISPDLTEVVGGNTAFALDLYQMVAEAEGGNIFFSPYSISAALAMTFAGARGETEAKMAEVLHLPSQDQTLSGMAALAAAMESRAHGAGTKEEGGVSFNVANALWGQKGYEFLPEFLNLLAKHYGAGLERADFAGNPQGSAGAINAWVDEQTRGMIQKVLSAGNIPPLTKLILVNAIYLNAAWKYKFSERRTRNRPFHLLNGEAVEVPMMEWDEGAELGYSRDQGYQAVELPYDGGELSMVILLPDADGFEKFEAALDAGRVVNIVSALHRQDVQVVMPRFELEWCVMLKEILSAMGMGIAFSDAADFSGMDGRKWLTIDEVIHKARVKVDEAGTEAAAVTVVVMRGKGAGMGPVYMKIDRPFIFLIRDIETKAILFVGRVMNPTAG